MGCGPVFPARLKLYAPTCPCLAHTFELYRSLKPFLEILMSETSSHLDACGEYGPTQRWAVVWFFSVIIIGLTAVAVLRNTDYFNYTSNGEFFDYAAYRSNKVGSLYIGSEEVDSRAHGDYASVTQSLANGEPSK